MRKLIWLSAFCLWPAAEGAAEYSSTYSRFDLDKTCTLIEKGDKFVYAGTWKCPGLKTFDVVVASADERDYVGFGEKASESCAFKKTFNSFNTALSPIEWRLKDGQPIAAIERWRAVMDDDRNGITWLVVTALKDGEACPVHYVVGSYPDANARARRAADDLAEDFNCETGVPTFDSKIGEPGITMMTCGELASE